jgi:hypothetical protein
MLLAYSIVRRVRIIEVEVRPLGGDTFKVEHVAPSTHAAGRPQLLLVKTELQSWLGKSFCDEAELLTILLVHPIVRRVRTIEVEVRPLGGDSFNVALDAKRPLVSEAKAEIARAQGTREAKQELYKVATRADGGAVREDDAEPELLDDEDMELRDGEIVAMAVKEGSIQWMDIEGAPHFVAEGQLVEFKADAKAAECGYGCARSAQTISRNANHEQGVMFTTNAHLNTCGQLGGFSIGLSNVDRINNRSDCEERSDYELVFEGDGHFYITEQGDETIEPPDTEWKPGDRWAIKVKSDTVMYLRNDKVVYESNRQPDFPLVVITNSCFPGTRVEDVQLVD